MLSMKNCSANVSSKCANVYFPNSFLTILLNEKSKTPVDLQEKTTSISIFKLPNISIIKNKAILSCWVFLHNVSHLEIKMWPGNIVIESGDRVYVPWLSTNQIPAFLLEVRYYIISFTCYNTIYVL